MTFAELSSRRTLRVVAAVAAVWCVLSMRMIVGARAELQTAEAFLAKARTYRPQSENVADRSPTDLDSAIVHLRRAARYYAPFNVYASRALTSLLAVAAELERSHDDLRALDAYRAARAAIQSSRSFFTPHASMLARADQRIAALMAKQPPPPIDAQKSFEQRRRDHLRLLTQPSRPKLVGSLMTLVGFFVWAVAAYRFFSRGIDSDDRLVRGEARKWAMTGALGFVLFAVGMYVA